MSAPENVRPLAQAPTATLVGQTLRHDLLTHIDFGDAVDLRSGWYTSWQNFRDFSLNDEWPGRSRATVRDYALWAFTVLTRDTREPEVGLRSVVIEGGKRRYPRDFGTEPGKEILLDPDTLIAAHRAGNLSLLKRRGVPRDGYAIDTLRRYIAALQS